MRTMVFSHTTVSSRRSTPSTSLKSVLQTWSNSPLVWQLSAVLEAPRSLRYGNERLALQMTTTNMCLGCWPKGYQYCSTRQSPAESFRRRRCATSANPTVRGQGNQSTRACCFDWRTHCIKGCGSRGLRCSLQW